MSGSKILEGLKDAVAGNFASVTIEGRRWVPADAPGWRTIESGLPEINETVLIVHKSQFDGKPIYAWGARLDGDEGWCWGLGQGYVGIRPDKDAIWNGIECDDEYEVTHWMPIPTPPEA